MTESKKRLQSAKGYVMDSPTTRGISSTSQRPKESSSMEAEFGEHWRLFSLKVSRAKLDNAMSMMRRDKVSNI